MPQFKNVPPQQVLVASAQLTIPEIGAKAAELTPQLRAELARHGLAEAGPWIFVSYGRNGDPGQTFRHDFCVPVTNATGYQGEFEVRELPALECFHLLHQGALAPERLGASYGGLVDAVVGAGRHFSGESREVWHHWAAADSPDNRVEIQLGVL